VQFIVQFIVCFLFLRFVVYHRIEETIQHELDEYGAFSSCIAICNGIVIVLLMVFDDSLYREPRK
jgi:hypothetical protein